VPVPLCDDVLHDQAQDSASELASKLASMHVEHLADPAFKAAQLDEARIGHGENLSRP
jgi:hypothetical protein